MAPTDMLLPAMALAGWTFCILLLIPITRFRAAFAGQVKADDFKLGESDSVPTFVKLVNRNYMNLLELPVLFYVVSLVAYVTALATPLMMWMAWAYVGLRVVHSLVHVTVNIVVVRLTVFAVSNFVLVGLWAILLVNILGARAT